MSCSALLLVAHGTRKQHGVEMIGVLAQRVSVLLGQQAHVAFVDVLGPTPSEVLSSPPLCTTPVTVVPAFLSHGYHVRTDIPAQVRGSAHPYVTVTSALGPDPALVHILADRLVESGWRRDDAVVLAAAGTSDPAGQTDVRATAARLSALTGSPVAPAFVATAEPRVHDVVSALRRNGHRRVIVASYLLSEGLFQDRLHASGADVVTEPLGLHPGLAHLVANRFRRSGDQFFDGVRGSFTAQVPAARR